MGIHRAESVARGYVGICRHECMYRVYGDTSRTNWEHLAELLSMRSSCSC